MCVCVCVFDLSGYWARFPICFVQPCCCLSFCGCTFAADRTAQFSYASTSNKFPLQRIKDCGDCVWQRLHCQRVEEFMQLPKNCRLKCMLMCCTNMYISLSLSHSLWHMLSFCGFCVINSILYVSYIKFVFVVYSILLLFWLTFTFMVQKSFIHKIPVIKQASRSTSQYMEYNIFVMSSFQIISSLFYLALQSEYNSMVLLRKWTVVNLCFAYQFIRMHLLCWLSVY